MIRMMNYDEIHIIEFMIDDFLSCYYDDKNKRSQLKDSLSNNVKSQKFSLLGGFNDDTPFCFGTIDSSGATVTMLYSIEGMWEQCFFEMVDYLKKQKTFVRILGSFIPEDVHELIINNGFRRFERVRMEISYDSFRSLNQVVLPDGYSMITYDPHTKEKIASLMLESYKGTSTSMIFPDYYDSLEGCDKCILSWGPTVRIYILVADKTLVGVCAISPNGNKLYVSNLSLIPAYHGKGLGKTLLILSLLEAAKGSDQVSIVNLDASIDDKAFNLYKKLGFITDRYISYFVWKKE